MARLAAQIDLTSPPSILSVVPAIQCAPGETMNASSSRPSFDQYYQPSIEKFRNRRSDLFSVRFQCEVARVEKAHHGLR
ncbi:hypothetical protein C7412_12468 [Paraburkholderia silvatlantica]|nr:hypothetical protein C7412_12468 [Paraburkholderia silvatlantica]